MKEHHLVDIHFHTNDSFDAYENRGYEEYDINKIIQHALDSKIGKISLICKTDHNILNYEKYLNEKKVLNMHGIEYFIGIEVRGNENVHWVFIFDNNELEIIKNDEKIGLSFEKELYQNIFSYSLEEDLIEQAKKVQEKNLEIEQFIDLLHRYKLSYLAIPHLNKDGGFYKVLKSNEDVLESLNMYLNDNVINGFESRQQTRFITDNIIKTQEWIKHYQEKLNGAITSEDIEEARKEINNRIEHLKRMKVLQEGVTRNNVSVICGSDFHGKDKLERYLDKKEQLFYMRAETTFQGLKFSLLDQFSRIYPVQQLNKYSKDAHDMISHIELEVNGKPKTIKFGDSLNSIIGARGSGKSFLLKAIIGNTENYIGSEIFDHIKVNKIIMSNGKKYEKLSESMYDYLGQQGSKKDDSHKNFYNLLASAPYNMTKFEEEIKKMGFNEKNTNKIDEYFNNLNELLNLYYTIYREQEKEIDYDFIKEYNSHFESIGQTEKVYDLFQTFDKNLSYQLDKLTKEKQIIEDAIKVNNQLNEKIQKISDFNLTKDISHSYLIAELNNQKILDEKLKKLLERYENQIQVHEKIQSYSNNIVIKLNKDIGGKTRVLTKKYEEIEKYVLTISKLVNSVRKSRENISGFPKVLTNITSYEYNKTRKTYTVNVIREFDANNIDKNAYDQIFGRYSKMIYNKNLLIIITGETGIEEFREISEKTDKRHSSHELKVPKLESRIEIKEDVNVFDWDKLSPGERANFLLSIVLDEDSTKILLMDQPEDDLDNETIYGTIVEKLRELKKKRQIILVSHNANIVINGDSDSITVSYNHDNQHDFVSKYTESVKKVYYPSHDKNYEIMELSAEILEGGREALRKRIRKIGNHNVFYKEIN